MFNKEKPVKIIIDQEKCTKCGVCTQTCSGEYIILRDNQIVENPNNLLGCIQCGRCMLKCPNNAIVIEAEGIDADKLTDFPAKPSDYKSLYSLLLKRRSARKFTDEPVSKELIEKVLTAATTGPVSLPPFEVKVLVIEGRDKVRAFKNDLLGAFKKMLVAFSPVGLGIMRFFVDKNTHKLFREFVAPLFKTTLDEAKKGHDILLYDAPVALIFYNSPVCDRDDAIIAATIASIAAESLGLGTCIIGSIPPSINNNPKIKAKYGIPEEDKVSVGLILGHPKETFDKGIKRDFKEVKWL